MDLNGRLIMGMTSHGLKGLTDIIMCMTSQGLKGLTDIIMCITWT